MCDVGMGVNGVISLAHAIKFMAALTSLTIDSTGVPYNAYVNGSGPKTYTLAASEETIDLSNMNLGSADVALVASWLQWVVAL